MIERQESVRIYDDEKEIVDHRIRSWLCSTQVGSESDVNLRLVVKRHSSQHDNPGRQGEDEMKMNCLEMGIINLILGCT